MLPFAGPLNSSAQTCFHGEVWLLESAADEQPVPPRTMRTPSPAASHRNQFEAPARSLASQGLLGHAATGRAAECR